jgi:hypothetical protein
MLISTRVPATTYVKQYQNVCRNPETISTGPIFIFIFIFHKDWEWMEKGNRYQEPGGTGQFYIS